MVAKAPILILLSMGSRFLLSPSLPLHLEVLGSFYWKISPSSCVTTLVSALCSTLVAVEVPFLYKEAQGERQQHLTKAASRYCVSLSGEEASLVWAVACGWVTGRDSASLYSGECEKSLSWGWEWGLP